MAAGTRRRSAGPVSPPNRGEDRSIYDSLRTTLRGRVHWMFTRSSLARDPAPGTRTRQFHVDAALTLEYVLENEPDACRRG